VRDSSPTRLNAEVGGSGVPGGKNFEDETFWPRSNFPLQPKSKETSRVPSETRGSTKECNWLKGKERRTLSHEIVAELLLRGILTFLFRITGLLATPSSQKFIQ